MKGNKAVTSMFTQSLFYVTLWLHLTIVVCLLSEGQKVLLTGYPVYINNLGSSR